MKMKSESEVTQSCPTLSNPLDCSPPGSSVYGIFQARAVEWGAPAFSVTAYSAISLMLNSKIRKHPWPTDAAALWPERWREAWEPRCEAHPQTQHCSGLPKSAAGLSQAFSCPYLCLFESQKHKAGSHTLERVKEILTYASRLGAPSAWPVWEKTRPRLVAWSFKTQRSLCRGQVFFCEPHFENCQLNLLTKGQGCSRFLKWGSLMEGPELPSVLLILRGNRLI